MNNITEQLLEAMDIIAEEKTSQLQFDKTVQAMIYEIKNLDIGEYKVRYKGNIFSAFAENPDNTYDVGEAVYIKVPEGDFSNKKFITSTVSSQSLTEGQMLELQNSVFELSPLFDEMYGGLYDRRKTYGVIAGMPEGQTGSYDYIYQGPQNFQSNGYHGLFQQYAGMYDLIRIKASFMTQFYDVHNKGSYGIEVEFYTYQDDPVTYTLDLNSFNGDPYGLTVFSPQYIIVKTQKNYLMGIKSIKLFERNFEYDRLIKNGQVTADQNTTVPNIFVKDIEIQYVDVKDLTDSNYYLMIKGLNGIALTNNISTLELLGRLVYKGKDIMDEKTCQCKWFVRDLTVMIGEDDLYDKEAGPGWRPLPQTTPKIILTKADIIYEQKYKLIVTYNETVFLQAEIQVFNLNNRYDYEIVQDITNGEIWLRLQNNQATKEVDEKIQQAWNEYQEDIKQIQEQMTNGTITTEYGNSRINTLRSNYDKLIKQYEAEKQLAIQNSVLKGDWFFSQPDGEYRAIKQNDNKPVNSIPVREYLRHSSTTFYCQVYDLSYSTIVGTTEYIVVNSESSEDVSVQYVGDDMFRYDANGDIAITDSEKERTLQVNLVWNSGIGTGYIVEWYMRDSLGNELPLTSAYYQPQDSMIEEIWVDNYNILHYNIRQKYKMNLNNNTLIVKVTTINQEQYYFYKEILFLKDGDQGTNGTTYVVAVRPCDGDLNKLSGLQPLVYNSGWRNTLRLNCYVYKDGELINYNPKFAITYKWIGVNVSIDLDSSQVVTVSGQGSPSSSSNSAELQFYVKAEVQITDSTNNRKIFVYASYPIDVAVGGIDYSLIDISSIPSYILYTASGVTPTFYSNNIEFLYNGNDMTTSINSMNPNILQIEESPADSGLYYLRPASSFIAENVKDLTQSNIGVLKCQYTTNQFFIHPVIMYLNTYGNEAINGWNGEELDIDERGQYIFAPQIGAGRKDSSNRFSGVVMGVKADPDVSENKTGLYGYQSGINTFGLMEDGKAFFGAKSGGGQIVVDGRYAIIYGGDVKINESSGNRITPAANGMYLVLADRNYKPTDPPVEDEDGEADFSKTKAIGIGYGTHENSNGRQVTEENFYVTYEGKLKATEADIHGVIYANTGQIGGSARRGGWTIGPNRLYSGSGSNHVELNSDSSNQYAIWAGGEDPESAHFSVTRDGSLYAKQGGEIAGWIIDRDKLYKGSVGMASSGNNGAAFWAGLDTPVGELSDSELNVNTETTKFLVTRSGKLYCSNATVTGTIKANKGEIGGWIISESGLSNGDNYIRSNGTMRLGQNFKVSDDGSLTLGEFCRITPNSFKWGDFLTVTDGTFSLSDGENSLRYSNGDLRISGNIHANNLSLGSSTRDVISKSTNDRGNVSISGDSIDCKGLLVGNKSGTNYFEVDYNGNVSIGGNISMGPGSTISWNNLSNINEAPFATSNDLDGFNVDLDKLKEHADKIAAAVGVQTQITGSYVWSPVISGAWIEGGTITGDKIYGGTIKGVTVEADVDLSAGYRLIFGDRTSITSGSGILGIGLTIEGGLELHLNGNRIYINGVELDDYIKGVA